MIILTDIIRAQKPHGYACALERLPPANPFAVDGLPDFRLARMQIGDRRKFSIARIEVLLKFGARKLRVQAIYCGLYGDSMYPCGAKLLSYPFYELVAWARRPTEGLGILKILTQDRAVVI